MIARNIFKSQSPYFKRAIGSNNTFTSLSLLSMKFASSVYIWRSSPTATTKSSQQITTGIKIRRGRPTKITALDDQNIEKIFFGIRHSAAITQDGRLFTLGNGNYGVLGHGDETNIDFKAPKQVEFFTKRKIKVKDVALGEFHSLALSADGKVYSWGYGGSTGIWAYFSQSKQYKLNTCILFNILDIGALGHGDQVTHYIPKQVKFFDQNNIKIKQIGAGVNLSVVLDQQGNVYSWGKGNYGLLGDGANTHALTPVLNQALYEYSKQNQENKIKSIQVSDQFTTALTRAKQLFVWGKNDRGQLGQDSGVGIDMIESQSIPSNMKFPQGQVPKIQEVQTGQNSILFRTDEGTIYRTGQKLDYVPRNTRKQYKELYDSNIRVMGCGTKHYIFVNEKGQIITWGNILNGLQKLDTGHAIGKVQTIFKAQGMKVKQLSVRYGTFGALLETV